ncbi:hypothetical protein [Streptomyces caelestis]|uniref:hypothetical protein n=1 Tax=Streptomyces caelestis TaxID=36816 RepID=UPI003702AD67
MTWLWKNRVLLPGVSVPARQVSEARTAAERRLYEAVARAAHRADPAPAPAPAQLLAVPDRKRVSELERLRTPPVKSTGTAMVRAMERVEEISAFALGRVNLSWVPVNRLSTLARHGQLSKAQYGGGRCGRNGGGPGAGGRRVGRGGDARSSGPRQAVVSVIASRVAASTLTSRPKETQPMMPHICVPSRK